MSKKQNKKVVVKAEVKVEEKQNAVSQESLLPNTLSSFWLQALILIVIGFLFYYNSFTNEYALDDGIVIEQNQYVKMGYKGIDSIMTKDAYDSFYKQMGAQQQLSGGRYRPLSIVTFAIEQQLLTDSTDAQLNRVPSRKLAQSLLDSVDAKGNKIASVELHRTKGDDYLIHMAHIRHKINVVLYILSIVILLFFLRKYLFPSNLSIAFIAALLFLTHPIHTEVVANVKSRDEILSFLFIILTFISAFEFVKAKSPLRYLLWAVVGMFFYFLAFLSKEYAITLVVLVPAALYVFTSNKEFKMGNTIAFTGMLLFIMFVYIGIRVSIVDAKTIDNPEILNNPYLKATREQKMATKISTAAHYLKLLVFPHPLSSDYSYNQIPYKKFNHYSVWLSILLHGFLIYWCIKNFFKKHPLSFAILFYFAYWALVVNLLFDIGATMGERLIYHSSLGFCMAVAYFIVMGFNKLKGEVSQRRITILVPLAILVVLYGFKAVERNADWKNDKTLFIKDVENVPNSVLANGNAGARCIDLADFPENKDKKDQYLQDALKYLNKAVTIHPGYVNGYLNLGLANYKMKNLEASDAAWAEARKRYPNNIYLKKFVPLLATEFLNRAFKRAGEKDFMNAVKDIEKAVELDPNNSNYWYHLGGAYFTTQQYDKAKQAWTQCVKLNPNNVEAQKGLAALSPAIPQKK